MLSRRNSKSKTQQKLKHIVLLSAFFVTLTIMVSLTNFVVNTNAQEDREKNIEIVESFLAKTYDEKDPKNAVKEYISEDFISSFTIDKAELENMLIEIQQGIPDLVRTSEPPIADKDGKFVVVFNKWNSSSGDGETAELFDVQNSKIVEHAMVGQYSEELKTKFKEFQSTNNDTDSN
jgi:hypothetical protein